MTEQFHNNSSSTYLFVDAGHLYQYFHETLSKFFLSDAEIDFEKLKRYFSAKKCFYYDCLDDKKKNKETEDEFQNRIKEHNERLTKIRETAGCHVRLGSLTGSDKNRRQKEVDVLLTVDMMTHAVRQNMTHAVLITGDRDFKPLVESLVQLGIFVTIAGHIKHTSMELAWAADNHDVLSLSKYCAFSNQNFGENYFPKKHKSYHLNDSDRKKVKQIEESNFKGRKILLYQIPNESTPIEALKAHLFNKTHKFLIEMPYFFSNGERLTIEHDDLDILKLYFELEYEKVEWQRI